MISLKNPVLSSVVLGLILSAPVSAWAITEANFSTRYDLEVAPFYATGVSGVLTGVDGEGIHYRKWENPLERGAIVLVNGRTETFVKYAEIAYDLASAGYSVYALDHRGQGLDARLVKNPHVGYVRHFDDYVTDLKTFVDTVVNAVPHAKRYMLGHSMGGGITVLYNEQHPNDFDAVVLSAPMIEVNTSPFPEWMAYDIASFLSGVGLGTAFAPGQKEYDPTTFETNTLTHSHARYDKADEITKALPQTYLGGASNRWVQQSMSAGTRMQKNAASFTAPVLLLQAGDDKLVRPGGQKTFCERAPRCQPIRAFAGSFHEILQERDEIRQPAMDAILSFFAAH